MPLDQDALDALRLTRAREEEVAARAEIADAKREASHLRDALHAAERRAQTAARRAERAAGVRRALEQQRFAPS
ncbi:MAG TPA: hypothetical protein VL856_15460 [Acidimicrobiia bacterium]|nr:hypothetical protein [Acidimicrobiia bacterium]